MTSNLSFAARDPADVPAPDEAAAATYDPPPFQQREYAEFDPAVI